MFATLPFGSILRMSTAASPRGPTVRVGLVTVVGVVVRFVGPLLVITVYEIKR